MKDLWATLEERTRTWNALSRQSVADAIWADYVSLRFGRSGNPKALEYLYPYLNHAQRQTRLKAIEVAAYVFEGRGPAVLDYLDYFTKHPDPFLRDRAIQVVGSAVRGLRDTVALKVLKPYLDHRNQFIRKLALVELGKASKGRASERVKAEIQRVAQQAGPREDEVALAIARVYAGRPTEEVYRLVAKPELADRIDTNNAYAVSVLVQGASDEWYERACQEVFEPRLHVGDDVKHSRFIRREGIHALCNAAKGRGIEALRRMLHLRGSRCTEHELLYDAPACFEGADGGLNRGPLIDLAQNGDVPEQRIAAVCLGKLMKGTEDAETIDMLKRLCQAPNRAVQAAALTGLGLVARSSCNEELKQLGLDRVYVNETAVAAIQTLGRLFLGSGHSKAFEQIRAIAHSYRERPVQGRKYRKPLAACYWATGLLYLGTGSTEPVEFLLEVLSLPRMPRTYAYAYQGVAAKALVMTEFPEPLLSRHLFRTELEAWEHYLGAL